MILQKTTLALVFSFIVVSVLAQGVEEGVAPNHARHYVGVQVNQLIRQILNFSGSSAVASNPYLINYSINFGEAQWGVNFGMGYTFNELTDGDAFTQRSTKINEFSTRIGFEKKTQFGKHWILSAGIDAVLESKNNTTRTNQGSGSPTFITKNESSGFGLGPRVTLNYEVTDRLLIGTEATYYFKTLSNTITNSGGGQDQKITEDNKSFVFGVPAVIFLILKF